MKRKRNTPEQIFRKILPGTQPVDMDSQMALVMLVKIRGQP